MSGVLSITILDCQEEDSGTYRCVCTNAKGEASDYATLDVAGGGYTTFSSRRKDEEAPKGHVPEASKIDHYHTTHFKTGYAAESHVAIEESKTKFTHERYTASSERYSSAERYESSVKYASTEYLSSGSSYSSEKFALTGKHAEKKAEVKEKTVAAVEEKAKPSLPSRILTKPQSVTLSEGETAKFSCDIDGEPTPTVTWIHETKTLISSQRIHISSTQYKSTLEIASVTSTDEGSYTVVVENSGGRQEAHFTLAIHRPPPKVEVKAVKSPEPSIKSPEPSIKSPEPSVKSPEASVKSPEPSIKSPEPSIKSPEPSVKSPEPSVKSPEPGIKSPVKSPEPSVKSPEPATAKSPEPEGIKSPRSMKSPEPGLKSPQGIKSPERVKSPEPEGIKSPRGVKSPEPVGVKKPLGVKSPEPAGIKSPRGIKSPEPTGIKSPRALKSPEPVGIKSPRALKSPEPEGMKSPPRMKSPPPIMSPKRVMSPPTIKAPPKVLSQVAAEACEGSVKMSCSCESSVKEVVWYVNGRKISQSSRFEMHYSEGSCSLLIHELSESDQGEYTCEMTSDGGMSKSTFSFTGQVFQSILMKVTAYREQQLTLKGSMTMSHKETSSAMLMKKEVHMVEESSSFSSTQQSMMSSMMESSSFSSMAAEMKFETMSMSSMSSMASESYAMSSSSLSEIASHMEGSMFRSLGGPPRIEALPEDISIEPGKVLTVACAFSGDAKNIEWSRGGKTIEVTAGGRFHIDTTDDLTTLIITGVKEEDAGTYTLKLSNELGSDAATVHISIRSA